MNCKRQSKLSKQVEREETTSTENETPAALLNDVVLQNIFKYLGYKGLKSVREVKNIKWLQNSKKAWWSQTKVAFLGSCGAPDKITEYINQTDINSHVTNYKLEYFEGDFKGFWEHFGHSIKYLELKNCSFDSVDSFRQVFYKKCPNLSKLVATGVRLSDSVEALQPMTWKKPEFGEQKNLKYLKLDFGWGVTPMSWLELLSHFPSLETLETNAKVDIYKVISVIRQRDPKKLKLRHINVNISSEESCRLVLLDPNLEFESIHITDKSCRPETVVDILDLHAKSLKRLSFGGQIASTGSRGCSPTELSLRQPLPSLENLKIECSLFTAEIFRFTPNLRKVQICYNDSYNLLKNVDPNLRIDTCKELSVTNYGRYSYSPQLDLPFFLNAFPNVEILRINGLNNSEFSMICERWTKLVSFIIYSGSQVDSFGLLGFDPDLKTETTRNPNITNLKGLQQFLMRSKQTLQRHDEASGKMAGIEMKNGDVILRELEKLPDLKRFGLRNYVGDISVEGRGLERYFYEVSNY